ncbi:MAG: two-component sensor histidine kinase, partial [Candidatus Aerophobus sp.]
AMPKGGTITLKTSFDLNNENVRVEIQDTGVGISSSDLPHIFEPFYTTKKDGKGVGLGLSVCYGIITGHNGQLDVKSALGKGSTFIIELPLLRVDSERKKVSSEKK